MTRQRQGAAPTVPSDPVAYLKSRGWTRLPCGERPYGPGYSWLPPGASLVATEERRKVGERVLPDGTREDVYQVHITPALVRGLTTLEALEAQAEREGR